MERTDRTPIMLVMIDIYCGKVEMKRVLLVEDHVSFGDSIAVMLEKEPGTEVVGQAASVKEALEFSDVEVDLAVVDLSLSDGNGADVIWELRGANPEIKV